LPNAGRQPPVKPWPVHVCERKIERKKNVRRRERERSAWALGLPNTGLGLMGQLWAACSWAVRAWWSAFLKKKKKTRTASVYFPLVDLLYQRTARARQ